ncbi:hypothetical protein ACFWWM_17535 [Streptomyces sp. NPDC058682]|uniref:hypothetical protein n=1 Tax=Streptomyces sp. NPDC058682 TaxID=3346596 RepID=UPI003650E31A
MVAGRQCGLEAVRRSQVLLLGGAPQAGGGGLTCNPGRDLEAAQAGSTVTVSASEDELSYQEIPPS